MTAYSHSNDKDVGERERKKGGSDKAEDAHFAEKEMKRE